MKPLLLLILMLLISDSVHAVKKVSAADRALPEASELVNINGHTLHFRKLGNDQSSKPSLLLLSGPTDNWHSDSGWWSLAQNLLAEDYHTIAIDRAGHVWSESVDHPSYRQFGQDLSSFISEQQKPVILVAFASSNLSLHLVMQDHQAASYVKGAVLIDPDALTEHSIEHYTSETERYREGWEGIEKYITSGQYDGNMQQKINDERAHLRSIITTEYEQYMDWDYYTAIEAVRNTRSYQLEKFRETTHYRDDLVEAKKHPLPASLPLVVIDSDFETGYLPKIEEQSVRSSIIQWRDEGRDWFFEITEKSHCGAYWPVASQEHLIMMEQPELVTRAVEKILSCEQKN